MTTSQQLVSRVHHLVTVMLLVAIGSAVAQVPRITTVDERADAGVRCIASSSNNWCAPQHHPEVMARVAELQDRGFTCSTKPTLTDHIIFQFRDDHSVAVLSYDDATSAGERNLGWVQRFCS